jgi:hypothetical protein
VTEQDEELGPAMRQLDRRRQKFVILYLQDARFGAGARAAKAAGFGDKNSTAHNFARIAHRLRSQQAVVNAIEEESRKQFRMLAPDALRVIKSPRRQQK